MPTAKISNLPNTLETNKVHGLKENDTGQCQSKYEEVTFISYTSDPVFVVIHMGDGRRRRVLCENLLDTLNAMDPPLF